MNLPGIKKIEVCNYTDLYLQPYEIMSTNTVANPSGPWKEICIVGLAEVVDATDNEFGQEVHKVELNYFCKNRPLFNTTPQVYKITDVVGNMYLIGTQTSPFAKRTIKNNIPSSPSGRRGYLVTISYKNTFGLLEVKE